LHRRENKIPVYEARKDRDQPPGESGNYKDVGDPFHEILRWAIEPFRLGLFAPERFVILSPVSCELLEQFPL
jgi:hypothetical protein